MGASMAQLVWGMDMDLMAVVQFLRESKDIFLYPVSGLALRPTQLLSNGYQGLFLRCKGTRV
jgi:hypothetical protein